MKQDEINKVETLIGYLEYFCGKRTTLENASDEILKVIQEAREWIDSEKKG